MANVQGICSAFDCDKPVHGRGLCVKHYKRLRKHGDPEFVRARLSACKIEGCSKKPFGHGWCSAHHFRWRKHGDPLAGGAALSSPGEPLRWMRKHLEFDGPQCLIWPFARHGRSDKRRYGAIVADGKRMMAHQWACEAAHGPRPSVEHEVAHSCGQGHNGCVHPQHLRWATKRENALDSVDHGTSRLGKPGPNRKLTASDVRAVRALHGAKSQSKIASMFGVTQTNIGRIHRRQTWAWLD